MLSEKAKGKQRATEPLDGPSASSSSARPSLHNGTASAKEGEETTRELVIRFTEGAPDLMVAVSKHDAVRDIKAKIRQARPDLAERRLRLIHAGRLLTDGIFVYSWLSSLEERQKRATLVNGSVDNSVPVPLRSSSSLPGGHGGTEGVTWIHCSVGPKLEPGEEVELEGKTQTAQLQPARGFDRLAAIGFSEADIANFRRQFHSQSASNYLDVDFETEEEYDEHARALEEQWIDSMDNADSAALSQNAGSANTAMLQGVLIGFFFPLIPFFFMRSHKPPVFWEDGGETDPPSNNIFSRRMQMGLVVGFLANLVFGFWRYILDFP
ncbi:hypothetical protein AX16_010583 [Volvariella volvacea WC 439]|nr:hypothetical protein AX16_010583 [Volvariella volvacea WC 439]